MVQATSIGSRSCDSFSRNLETIPVRVVCANESEDKLNTKKECKAFGSKSSEYIKQAEDRNDKSQNFQTNQRLY